jgi:hypothetical protein
MNIVFLDWIIRPAQEENRAMESGSTYMSFSVIRVCFIKKFLWKRDYRLNTKNTGKT